MNYEGDRIKIYRDIIESFNIFENTSKNLRQKYII